MPEHETRTVERHCDVAIVGGSVAGLTAALHLVRQGWSVIVVDSGGPRRSREASGDARARTDGVASPGLIEAGREDVRGHGGEILAGRVTGVERVDDEGVRLHLAGGHSIMARRALAVAGWGELTREAAGRSKSDATGATSIPHLYALGELSTLARWSSRVEDAHRVAEVINSSLVEDDPAAARPSANQADWDHRYEGASMWSGNPNGSLVNEVRAMTPGRALDVGAGEGGDALWLAEQGWRVTASDISQLALNRLDAEAQRRGLQVECHRVDANAPDAFVSGAFDLVSAQYASIPRTADGRGVRNLLNAVGRGGTLLIVNHDLEPMRADIDAGVHTRAFDPDAYLRTEDFVAAVSGSPDWDIECHERRTRPPGAASASHHVDDVILRLRRHPS